MQTAQSRALRRLLQRQPLQQRLLVLLLRQALRLRSPAHRLQAVPAVVAHPAVVQVADLVLADLPVPVGPAQAEPLVPTRRLN